jgi:hypothetical protein
MPHDETSTHWHEPKAGENAGFGKFKRPAMPYDRFMEAEGVPVYRSIGCRTVLDLPMAPWKRLGGRGTYIQLFGTEGLWGMYVVEVPAGGALNIELMRQLALALPGVQVLSTEARGLPPLQVEAAAFAWLAQAFTLKQPGNLVAVTGAKGPRVLGALHRAPPFLP